MVLPASLNKSNKHGSRVGWIRIHIKVEAKEMRERNEAAVSEGKGREGKKKWR
jgi:hypothetical protein